MDLALQTGWSLASLMRMDEREFGYWAMYASQKGFPLRRLELYLARIAQLIAVTMGGAQNASLKDYLFDPQDQVDDAGGEITDEELQALKAEIGFNPDYG